MTKRFSILRTALVADKKYTNLNDFKRKVLEPARIELKETSGVPIHFEYQNHGNKQRNVTHIEFTVITAIEMSQLEKQEFNSAVQVNPLLVYEKVEEIIDKFYHFRKTHKELILSDKNLINQFVTLHIEFENGLYPKVKNKTAYILACLGLIKKRSTK